MKLFDLKLTLARGFLNLSMYHYAWEELEKLSPEATAHPAVLLMKLDIQLALHRWEDAAALGAKCCRDWRTYDEFFLRTASALMHVNDHAKALELLKSGPPELSQRDEYHYAVARCAARGVH